MPHDNLTEQLNRLASADAGEIPSAFKSRVTRRRWARRATGAGAAAVAIAACFAVVMVMNRPSPNPTPLPQPDLVMIESPATTKFADTSLAVLSRAGLSARVFQDAPRPHAAVSAAPAVTEPPLRAFDVARVLRGL